MQDINCKIIGVFVGMPKPLGNSDLVSAMSKTSVDGDLDINFSNLPGDQVADTRHHGGLDRVIHHYSIEQYNHLKVKFPEHSNKFVPGSYGENITTETLTEKDLCLGDMFQLGTSKVEISEPRQPCRTIDVKYGIKGVLKEIAESRRYGWFYRVLEEGKVATGDRLVLIERPYPQFNLDKIILETYQTKNKDMVFLREVRACSALSKLTRTHIDRIIDNI